MSQKNFGLEIAALLLASYVIYKAMQQSKNLPVQSLKDWLISNT